VLVVLGQRTITKGFVRLPSNWVVVALVVSLFALAAVASCVVFTASPSTTGTSLHPSVASSALTQAPIAERASLDNDLDNDGKVDGTADSLGALLDGMVDPLVDLAIVSLLIPLVGGSLSLLSIYKLPMIGCDYSLPVERPG
jgi:hypothetical protein